MRKRRSPGLDELMIVNPGRPGSRAAFRYRDGFLHPARGAGAAGRLFLAEAGTLYQVPGLGASDWNALGQYFLGEDGTLYVILRE